MASINDVCKDIIDNIDGALGAAVVDVHSGLLLGSYHNVPYFTNSFLDSVAAAAVDMFRGRRVSNIEKRLGQIRDDDTRNAILEIQMTTSRTFHFMAIIPGKPDALAILITDKDVNLGLGWSGLRSALPELAQMCP